MGERRKEVRRVEKGEGEGRQEESGGEVGWGIRERGDRRRVEGRWDGESGRGENKGGWMEERWVNKQMDGVQEVMRRMRGKGASSEGDS